MTDHEIEMHMEEHGLVFLKDRLAEYTFDGVPPALIYAVSTVYNPNGKIFYFQSLDLDIYANGRPIFFVSNKIALNGGGTEKYGKLFLFRKSLEKGTFGMHPLGSDGYLEYSRGLHYNSEDGCEILFVYETN